MWIGYSCRGFRFNLEIYIQIARVMWPTLGPPGSRRPQMGPHVGPMNLTTIKVYIKICRWYTLLSAGQAFTKYQVITKTKITILWKKYLKTMPFSGHCATNSKLISRNRFPVMREPCHDWCSSTTSWQILIADVCRFSCQNHWQPSLIPWQISMLDISLVFDETFMEWIQQGVILIQLCCHVTIEIQHLWNLYNWKMIWYRTIYDDMVMEYNMKCNILLKGPIAWTQSLLNGLSIQCDENLRSYRLQFTCYLWFP